MYGDEKRCAQNIEALGRFLNKAKELNIYEKYKDEFEYYCFKETVMQCMNIVSDKNRYLEVSQETWNLMFSFLRKEFPNYLENKYLNSMFERRTVCRIRLLEKGKKSVEKFQMKEDEIVYNKTKELLLKYTDKVVGIWGAGQKGKAFLQKYDRDNKQIKYVVDSNPELWGTYMETGHLITGIEKIKGQVDVILCMNFRYFDEMQEDLVTANMDKKVNLIDYERYIYDDWED
jgi:hypothetical protein